jgi:hypothetical protein
VFLREMLQASFKGRLAKRVLYPPELESVTAVMIGAAEYARDPSIVRMRKIRHTYGCKMVSDLNGTS